MFDKQRYLTRGINEEVSIPIQTRLWRLIETMDSIKDYLQVFDLEQLTSNYVRVIHHQEEPPYQNTIICIGKLPSEKLKIFVIEDGSYSTMLLASEY